MAAGRTRYELLVGRHLSPATLATFPVALVPTAVPRNTVHRLRVGVDSSSDLAEIVRRLTERNVALLEIRRCPDRPWWRRGSPRTTARAEADGEVDGEVDGTGVVEVEGDGVVVPFPSLPVSTAANTDEDDRVPVAPVLLHQPSGRGGSGSRRRLRPASRD